MADREFNGQILDLLGEELAMKIYAYAKSRPVSFSAVGKEVILRRVEILHGKGDSKQFIARKIGKSVRQVERYESTGTGT